MPTGEHIITKQEVRTMGRLEARHLALLLLKSSLSSNRDPSTHFPMWYRDSIHCGTEVSLMYHKDGHK